jgi:hypothetical protein
MLGGSLKRGLCIYHCMKFRNLLATTMDFGRLLSGHSIQGLVRTEKKSINIDLFSNYLLIQFSPLGICIKAISNMLIEINYSNS